MKVDPLTNVLLIPQMIGSIPSKVNHMITKQYAAPRSPYPTTTVLSDICTSMGVVSKPALKTDSQ